MPSAFESKPESSAPGWLRDKVYTPKKQRTVELVTRAVEALKRGKQRISLAAISRKTKEIDPTGVGISESAILTNEAAYACYKQHCSWKTRSTGRSYQAKAENQVQIRPALLGRDIARVRQRYLRLSKNELVERLLAVEQAYAEQEERWLQASEELLLIELRARNGRS